MDQTFLSAASGAASSSAPNRLWQGEGVDPDIKETLEKLRKNDIDTNFGIEQYKQSKSKKGTKETFYCEYCKIELNSIETRDSHTVGVKHQAKVRELGGYGDLRVKVIPNPLVMQKKIVTRLHQKIRITRDPVVGLEFVDEFLSEYNADETEPYYECAICGKQVLKTVFRKSDRYRF